MSYDDIEDSVNEGRPYWLYFFVDPTHGVTRLTSDPEDIDLGLGGLWTASPIDASDMEVTGNVERQDMTFTFPLSDEFGRRYLDYASFITTLTVYRGHHADPLGELSVHWKGRIVGGVAIGDSIKVTAESIFSSVKRIGNAPSVTKACRHALYHPGCDLDRADFETAGTVTVVSGLVLTIPAAALLPAGDLRAGIVNWNGLMSSVEVHSGSILTLLTKIPGLAEYVTLHGSAAVLLAPGCVRIRTRCDDRFDNSLNFGGFDRMPTVNPFSTSII